MNDKFFGAATIQHEGEITPETFLAIDLDLSGFDDIEKVRRILYRVKDIVEKGGYGYKIDLGKIKIQITQEQHDSKSSVSGDSVVNAISPFLSCCTILKD